MYLAFVNEIGMRTGTSLHCGDEWHLFAYCLNVFRCTKDVGNYMIKLWHLIGIIYIQRFKIAQ
jgi:hypothetical protein